MPAENRTRPAILQALAAGDMAAAELADELAVRLKTAEYNLRNMRAEGVLHICDWRKPARQGKRAAVYRLGAGREVRMTRMSAREKAESQAAWARRRRMQQRLVASKGNPFGALIAQVAPALNRGQFGMRGWE